MVTIKDFLFVVVLYKKKLTDSITVQSLGSSTVEKDLKIDLFIYDNSPVKEGDEVDPQLNILKYVHNPANGGLSKAYNMAGKFAQKIGKKWLLLFDQDTIVSNNAAAIYLESINRYPDIKLFSPILKSGEVIVSPSMFRARRGRPIKAINPGLHSLKNMSPLNSGIAVEIDFFESIGGYNEAVKLDYSDYAFIDRVKKHTEKFYLIDLTFAHELSAHEDVSQEMSIKRFSSLCEGLINSSANKFDLFNSFFVALRRCLRLTLNHRTTVFFKELSNQFFKQKNKP